MLMSLILFHDWKSLEILDFFFFRIYVNVLVYKFYSEQNKLYICNCNRKLILGWRLNWIPEVEEFNSVRRGKRSRVLRFPGITVWEPLMRLTLEHSDHKRREVRLMWIIVWTLNTILAERSLYFSISCNYYWTNWIHLQLWSCTEGHLDY